MKKLLLLTIVFFMTNLTYANNCDEKKKGYCQLKPMKLVPNVKEFIAARNELSKTPWGGSAMLVNALLMYQINRVEAEKMLILAFHESRIDKVSAKSAKGSIYKGYRWRNSEDYLLNQVKKVPHCIRSLVIGATPKNGYKIDKKNLSFKFRVQTKYVGSIASGSYKVFICSSGTSSCRPVNMKRNEKGIWKASGFSTLAVGCARSIDKPSAESKAANEL